MKRVVYSPHVLQELHDYFHPNPYKTLRKQFHHLHPSFISQICPFRQYNQDKWTIDDFEVTKEELGSGTYGDVVKAYHKSSKYPCALKLVKKSVYTEKKETALLFREIQLQHELGYHPQIVSLYGCFDIDGTDDFAIVLELVEGPDLFEYLDRRNGISLTDLQIIFSQLLQAVQFCHNNHIIHRDIKLENIKVDRDLNVKLIDFGFALRFEDHASEFFGTFYAMAPEVCHAHQGKGNQQYDYRIDIWSCGIVLYYMMTGEIPWDPKSSQGMHDFVNELYQFPLHNPNIPLLTTLVPSPIRHILINMLQTNVQKRASIMDILKDVELFASDDTAAILSRDFFFDYERAQHIRDELNKTESKCQDLKLSTLQNKRSQNKKKK
jgi:serine/threonine protein kinase